MGTHTCACACAVGTLVHMGAATLTMRARTRTHALTRVKDRAACVRSATLAHRRTAKATAPPATVRLPGSDSADKLTDQTEETMREAESSTELDEDDDLALMHLQTCSAKVCRQCTGYFTQLAHLYDHLFVQFASPKRRARRSSTKQYIVQRARNIDGKTVHEAMGMLYNDGTANNFENSGSRYVKGEDPGVRGYKPADFLYDIKNGIIRVVRAKKEGCKPFAAGVEDDDDDQLLIKKVKMPSKNLRMLSDEEDDNDEVVEESDIEDQAEEPEKCERRTQGPALIPKPKSTETAASIFETSVKTGAKVLCQPQDHDQMSQSSSDVDEKG